ncbi:MAG: septation protein A [Azoarcus sp.]|jgi:intracellular septation protein|nr:septation protein A [Azoarcus sp.]
MKFLFDLFPLIVFFLAYTFANASPEAAQAMASRWLGGAIPVDQAPILIATATAIVATVLQIAAVWLKTRKVGSMLWISLALIGVLGGATLFFRDPAFIKWKPTVLYWLFGAALIGSNLFFRRNLIRNMLEAQIRLPDPVWRRLNWSWALFFVALGLLNLYVAYGFEPTIWVNFKIFGCTGLILAFSFAQVFYLSKHLIEDKPNG